MRRPAITQARLLGSYLPLLVGVLALMMMVCLLPSKPQGGVDPGSAGSASIAVTGADDAGGKPSTSRAGQPAVSSTPLPGLPGSQSPGATGSGDGALPSSSGAGPREDCSRQKVIDVPTCRPLPKFSGDNGGATYRNVSRTQMTIVIYEPAQTQQLGSLVGQSGSAGSQQNRDALEAYQIYMNKVFETYGRSVKVIYQEGPGTQDPSEQIADAKYVVNTLHASIVISAVGSGPFHDEVARLGIPEISGALGFPASYYEKHAPYLFSMYPDMDLTLDHFAEYYCKRLAGRKASFAGNDSYHQQTRKLGIIWPSDNSVLINVGPVMQSKLKSRCGVVAKMVSYTGDVSTITQQATNVIAQMKAAGVTSITLPSDPLSPVFFTQAAATQDYRPEWISNAILLTDIPSFIRLYNASEMKNYFGPSVQGYYTPVAQDEGVKTYFAAKPHGSMATATSSAREYCPMLVEAFLGIERAGPTFTAAAFGRALLDSPVLGGSKPRDIRLSFGNHGPSPWTGIDNFMEFWWWGQHVGPDGKKGWTFYLNGGRRYEVGQWPTTVPKVGVNDGSAQPGPDPDL